MEVEVSKKGVGDRSACVARPRLLVFARVVKNGKATVT